MTHVDVSSFASKANLASLKTEVGKLDIAKLTSVLDDLAKLSNVVKIDVVKKTEYNKLVTKVDNIDTTGFALKTKYDADKSEEKKELKKVSDMIRKEGGLATKNEVAAFENKTPDVSGLVKKKTDLNAKITETEGKIPSISGLTTNSAFTAVENKIPNVNNLVKKKSITQKLVKLNVKSIIIIMTNILLLQNLIS